MGGCWVYWSGSLAAPLAASEEAQERKQEDLLTSEEEEEEEEGEEEMEEGEEAFIHLRVSALGPLVFITGPD